MKRIIDCLLIGPNEMSFANYKNVADKLLHQKANSSDVDFTYVNYKGKDYRAVELLKKIAFDTPEEELTGSFCVNETVSAAILYLGTAIFNSGLSFDFVKSFQSCKQEIIRILSENDVLSIAVTTTLYVNPWPVIEIVRFLRKYCKTPIIVGGPFILGQKLAGHEDDFLSILKLVNADFYIASPYGENTLCDIIRSIKYGTSFEHIANTYYRKDSAYQYTFRREEEYNLDEHRVNWGLFENRLGSMVTTRTSLSCPFSCAFCEYPLRAGKYRTLSLDLIERELKALNDIGGVESISFLDDTFNVPPERFKEILRMMIRNRFTFKWFSYFRCQYADSETLHLMKESGCEGVILGIESGSQSILDNMNKKVQIEKYEAGLNLLNELGIPSLASFIIGFPGENADTIRETVAFIEACKPTFYKLWLWYYSPFTPIGNQREKYQLRGSGVDWVHSSMDAGQAQEFIDSIYLGVKNSHHSPFYFEDIMTLLHKGFDIEKVKRFTGAFNGIIRKRMINELRQEECESVILKLAEDLKKI